MKFVPHPLKVQAWLGLFATKLIQPGSRITKYSGKIISHSEADASDSSYLLHINKKICLDASGPGHMVGRYCNEGSISNIANNARFGASQRVYVCKKTGRSWVSVLATKLIHPNEEIFSDYGPLIKWKNLPTPSDTPPDNDDSSDSSGHHSSDTADRSSDETCSPPAPNSGTSGKDQSAYW